MLTTTKSYIVVECLFTLDREKIATKRKRKKYYYVDLTSLEFWIFGNACNFGKSQQVFHRNFSNILFMICMNDPKVFYTIFNGNGLPSQMGFKPMTKPSLRFRVYNVLTNEILPFCNLSLNFKNTVLFIMDVKLQWVFTLPNENRQRSKKRNSKGEFTTSFAHNLVKGPKFQYLCERERGLRNSRKETKEELFYIQVFSLLFNYLLSLLAIWSDFSVFEKKSNLS